MYILTRLKDTLKIEPTDFGKDTETALKHEINRKYTNKVLPNVGLCVAMFEIDDCSEGIILQGDGSIFYKVIFRMVVFKPFADEILLGKVSKSSRDGVKFSLNFFDDCWIPHWRLPPNTAFDPTRSEWYWVPEAEDDEGNPVNLAKVPEDERFYIIAGETIRVRITSESFNDTTPKSAPKPPPPTQGPTGPTGAGTGAPDTYADAHAQAAASAPAGPPAYSIEASIQEQGLGLLNWWIVPEQEDGAEGEAGAEENGDASEMEE